MGKEDSSSSTDGWFMRSVKTITATAAAIAGILGIIIAYDPAATAWCKNFGTLCTFDRETAVHIVKVSDGNPCDNAAPQICIERTNTRRALDTSSLKFMRQLSGGQFEEVKPRPSIDPNGAGWFVDPKYPATQAKICAVVFAHTMACENKYSITGKLVAKEKQPLSALWKEDVLAN